MSTHSLWYSQHLTYSGIGSHVVPIVKTDEGQIRHMRREGQNEQNSHHTGNCRPTQAQRPETEILILKSPS